jgi:glycosidase
MAMAFLLTTRGTPMIYYGTELLMTGKENQGHGFIRQDFPTVGQLDHVILIRQPAEKDLPANHIPEAYAFLKALLNWRKGEEVIHSGMLKQFVPQDGIYVYFRYNENKTVMVVMNNNDREKTFNWDRFTEASEGFAKATNILDGKEYAVGALFNLAPKSVEILEFSR